MPELPEVQTTVSGLQGVLPKLRISGVWTDIAVKKPSLRHFDDTIKNLSFFNNFKKRVRGQKILRVTRRAKNILIHLADGDIILIHMKMTGNLLYGKYKPGDRFIHVIFELSNKKQLAFSDSRKFGKVTLIPKGEFETTPHLKHLGPEPLEKRFTFLEFKKALDKKPTWKIKTALMDQTLISGIGNIYSDEMLWYAGVNPEEREKNIPLPKMKAMFEAMKKVLKKGIDFGGDSMSDYKNIHNEKGEFQLHHQAYQKKGEKCGKKDGGVIIRKIVGGRSAHFCPVHQKLIKK
jgi:formamidopyrimidine-DNA glycosylase